MRDVYLTERGNFWCAIDERLESATHGQIIGIVGAQCPPDPTPHTDGSVVPASDSGAEPRATISHSIEYHKRLEILGQRCL